MKIKSTILLLLVSITMLSCRKEGCTDNYALNYDEDAKHNDYSCVYYTNAKITYVSCSSWPSTNFWGNPWDPTSDPDTYLSISLADNNGSTMYYDGPVSNNNPGNLVEFVVNMNPIDSLNKEISISLNDDDGLFDTYMTGETINLWEFTHEGSFNHKYPNVITRGSFTINVEWIE